MVPIFRHDCEISRSGLPKILLLIASIAVELLIRLLADIIEFDIVIASSLP